jgi:diguanylate cyclase
MLDIDHFKEVNDTYGHPIGDTVLQAIANECRRSLRTIDILGRYGGEEFVILLPETGLNEGARAAERLRSQVEKIHSPLADIKITISLGLAELTTDCPDLEALIERADKALYLAKQGGRNQVCYFK